MKKLKKQLAELRKAIKALADKDDLSKEETDELEAKISQAKSLEARIKAAEALGADIGDTGSVDVEAIVSATAKAVRADMQAEAEAKAAEEKQWEERLADARKEWEAESPAWRGGFNVSRIQHDDPNDDGGLDSFKHYLRTGDGGGYVKVMRESAAKALPFWENTLEVKAALQGQTDAEGGYLVPDDFYNQIVAKRDDASVIRRAGATVIQTSLDRVLIPTEGTSLTAHAITAEEAAVDEEEPTFGQAVATIYKATKLIKVSEELVADEAANLLPFLNNALGRAEAAWENTYFVSQGNGSGQPNSGLNVSSVQVTASGTNSVTAAEVKELLFDLPAPYAESASAAIVGRRAVLGAISALTGNPFSFATMPAGDIQASRGQFGNVIDGIPYFSDETMPAFTTGNKVLLFADWSYYFVAERMGSMIQRLNELYAGNGQIGFLHKFRRGGVPTQSEAFIHLVTS